MSDNVLMPALGESVTEGTVTRWLKQVGDTVEVDEPLLEVSTDKVDTEIPSPFAGTLLEILVDEDDTVDVGAPLARIGSAEDAGGQAGGDQTGEQDGEQAAEQGAGDQEEAPAEQHGEDASDSADAAEDQQAAQIPEEVTQESSSGGTSTGGDDTGPPASADAGSTGGDAQDVTLPALGESVTEGTVTRWLKEVGESVEVDEPLLEVSTDKVDTEIPSPVAGTLLEVLVGEDETVEVGAVLARVGSSASGGASGGSPETASSEAEGQDGSAAPEAGQPGGDYSGTASQADTVAPSDAPAGAEGQESSDDEVQQPQPSQAAVEKPEQTQAPGQAAAREQTPTSTAPSDGGSAAGGGGDTPPPATGGYLTPLVRKLAAEKGVDLSSLTGTGVGGRIRKEDVLAAAQKAEQERAEREKAEQEKAQQASSQTAERPAPAQRTAPAPEVSPLRGTTEKASRLRQIIAERMVDALHSMAQLTTVVEVDVTRVAQLRTRAKEDFRAREGVNLTYLPFFVLAATEALKAHPKVNGVLDGKEITYHGQENVGIAVDTERGLVVPVIRQAGDLNLAGIARKINDLATRTRDNKATPDDLSGATFTVTNTGSGGALFDTPIVPGGTSAILGTGSIVKRPVVAKDEFGQEFVAIRSMCYLALSYDHRLVDGADASRYLMAVKKRIEEGAFESELGL